MTTLPQQPSSMTEIWSASFKLYAESFTKVIGYSLIVFTFQALLTVYIINALPDTVEISTTVAIPATEHPVSTEEAAVLRQQAIFMRQAAMQEATSGLTGVQFALILFTSVLYSAMLYRIDNVANKRDDDFVGVLLSAVKKLHLLIFAGIVYGIVVIIGIFLFVIPGIILWNSLLFFGVLILLEDRGIFESLMTSHRLVWGDWWRTFIVFFIPVFVFLVIASTIIAFTIFQSTFDVADFDVTDILYAGIGTHLLAAVIVPYFYVLIYLQYHDLKLRKNM